MEEVPRLLIEDHSQGELWFRESGEAVYRPPDEGTAIVSFRYGVGAESEGAGSATVSVLVNGADDLPEGSLKNDEALKACSHATALDTLKHDVVGEPVPAPRAGERVEVPVDSFAGHEIVLTNEDFGDAKYLEGDGGILFLLRDGRLVFLAGADQTDVKVPPKYVVLDEIWDPVNRTAADVLEYAKGEWKKLPPAEAYAELAANQQAFLTAPSGETSTEALARTELPFCRTTECQVYEYQGDGYVRVGATVRAEASWHAPGLDDLWFAGDVDWLAHGSRPAMMLAAVGAMEGLDSDLSPLGAYWLERDPEASVIRLDDFFARADESDPPDLSIAESHFVPADDLLRLAQPVTLPGFVAEDIVRWIPHSAFPPRDVGGAFEHGGGAGFSPYGQGGIGEGPRPILVQQPTALPPREPLPGPVTKPPPEGGNLAPVARADVAATLSDQPISLHPLANDSDPDGDPIEIARVLGVLEIGSPGAAAGGTLGTLATVPDGEAEPVDGRTINYTPGTLFATTSGTATIRYTVRDDRGAESEPATITVAVALENDPPVAVVDKRDTGVNQPVTVDVLENDFDQDDIPNSLLGDAGEIPLTIQSIVQPAHGTVERVGPRGQQQLTYEPDENFENTDSFTYRAFDGLSLSNEATVTVRVDGPHPPNQPPVGRPDEGLAQVGGPPIMIDVLDNDSDPDGDPLSIFRLGDPKLGSARIGDDVVVYTPPTTLPDPDQPGRIDLTFTYTITDGQDPSDPTPIRVDLNRAPVSGADCDLAQVGGPTIAIDVLANDRDPDGDPLTIVEPADPELGSASLGDGEILYTPPSTLPDPERPGRVADTFTYTITDDRGAMPVPAQVTVDLNRAPEAVADQAKVQGGTIAIDVLANDGDLDGDSLRIDEVSATALGAEVSIDGQQILYTRPVSVGEGEPFRDTFTYTIVDLQPPGDCPIDGTLRGGMATATVTVFGGGPAAPMLTVVPSEVNIEYVTERRFDSDPPFPKLVEGQAVYRVNGVAPDDIVNGVDQGDLTLDATRDVSVTFVSEVARFQNSLGYYVVGDAGDQSMPAHIVFPRVETSVLDTDPVDLGAFTAGTELGFFLVQDGFRLNDDGALDPEGEFELRDAGGSWQLFRIDGDSEQAITGTIFHTADPETDPEQQLQTISGRNAEGDALKIGFEDELRSDPRADDDFNDTVFQVSYGPAPPPPPSLGLTATIDDLDSPFMTHASVKSSQNGDQLVLRPGDILDDTGIALAGEGTDELVFQGDAPIADYEEALGAVELAAGSTGDRELTFQVFDDTNLVNQPEAKVEVAVAPEATGDLINAGALLANLVPDQPVAA